MEFDGDELAGIVDLFGGLTRPELGEALSELAFRAGEEREPRSFEPTISAALERYRLLAVDAGDETLFVAGPVAFPVLPEHATDLPYILDVPERSLEDDALASRLSTRLDAEAAAAVETGDATRAAELIDVTYDAETWADVDLEGVRATLEAVT